MCKKKQVPICMYVLIGILLLGVILGPWLFTQPCFRGWKSLDFTSTGDIGDTIGGITAPFIGLLSILLLVWTLQEQIRINQKQTEFNDKQIKYNDATRILSLQTQIMQIDDSIRFGYCTKSSLQEGRGCSSLSLLQKGTLEEVSILYDELEMLIDKVHMLEKSNALLIEIVNKSDLLEEEKRAALIIPQIYLNEIKQFYDLVLSDKVDYILPIEVFTAYVDDATAFDVKLKMKVKGYMDSLRTLAID